MLQNAQAELMILRSGEPSNACRVRCYTQDLSGQDGEGHVRQDKVKRSELELMGKFKYW